VVTVEAENVAKAFSMFVVRRGEGYELSCMEYSNAPFKK
jgi:hypothetical protein